MENTVEFSTIQVSYKIIQKNFAGAKIEYKKNSDNLKKKVWLFLTNKGNIIINGFVKFSHVLNGF